MGKNGGQVCAVVMLLLQAAMVALSYKGVPPPLPVMPIPNARQLKWQQREMVMFLHFGMNTFTDSEWGTGMEDPHLFNPKGLDANQWTRAAKDAGFSLVILTAKHHDGFCLWPSAYTNHSVISSPWKKGHGDIVKELEEATRNAGLDMGLYLSPWDRHEPTYGLELEYNEFYLGQLQELLTKYGPMSEIWFDGAKGSNAPNMSYMFPKWFAMAHELQMPTNIFSDAGPDVRWVGDEKGAAGSTCWSTINRTALKIGDADIVDYLNTGDPHGKDWLPAECDVSIRKGWFWHKSEKPKPLSELLDIYYKSVGRNCVLLLNVPPNTSGLVAEEDVQRLLEFRKAINTIFSTNLAASASITASSVRGGPNGAFRPENVLNDDLWSYWAPNGKSRGGSVDEDHNEHWLELKNNGDGDKMMKFNVVKIQEAIGMGQRVMKYEVYANALQTDHKGNGIQDMVIVSNGTTIGYKRLHRLENIVQARSIRIVLKKSRGVPLIASLGVHFDPYYPKKHYQTGRNSTQKIGV
eukprot:Gb_14859 [translate_table: standard]